jgi:hypothetical protein
MKMLKSEQEYKYEDFRELQCAVCKKSYGTKARRLSPTPG